MRPNLFKYGTSELTHDAILSWCLAWGNYKDEELYALSKDFIKLLIGQEIELEKVEILQQKYHIDILVLVNDEILIVIEDKVDTGAREGQLKKYKDEVEKNYPTYKKFYNYITIGDEDSYLYIKKEGYKVIERSNLLDLLEDYKDKNHILMDYYDYLQRIESDYRLFEKEENLSKWTWRTWDGFFKEKLYSMFKDEKPGWGYVSNPRGGFIAFYWAFNEFKFVNNIPFTIYLQVEAVSEPVEASKIALKISVDDKDNRRIIRDDIRYKFEQSLDKDSSFKKPIRLGFGKTMTIGEIRGFTTKEQLNGSIYEANSKYKKFKSELSKYFI